MTTQKKKEILLNNIYGVDIDSQAVEVTKLNLLLKVLEGETKDTLESQMKLWRHRALPDLGNNIKCGNSLIGPDYYYGKQLSLLDDEEKYKINVFDWKAEFSEIMKQGGFDAVIGNPPYVLLQDEFRNDEQLSYFKSKFTTAAYKIDTYHLFIEKGIRLTRPEGRFSMITPANFLTNNYLSELRRFILKNSLIDHILVIEGGVFRGISVNNAVFVVLPGLPTKKTFRIAHAHLKSIGLTEESETLISAERALAEESVLFTGASEKKLSNLWKRIYEKSNALSKIADVNFGKQLRDRKRFKKDVIQVTRPNAVTGFYKPCYTGKDVKRYFIRWGNLACLDKEEARQGGCWDSDKQNAKNKLITRQIGRNPEFALDKLGYQCLNTVFMVNVKNEDYDPQFLW